eukprot:4938973-Prymnesium_polylepis.1
MNVVKTCSRCGRSCAHLLRLHRFRAEKARPWLQCGKALARFATGREFFCTVPRDLGRRGRGRSLGLAHSSKCSAPRTAGAVIEVCGADCGEPLKIRGDMIQ